MNIIKSSLLILLLFLNVWTVAQNRQLQDAIQYYQNGELNKSRQLIDNCSDLPEYQADPNFWYLKGFIYKDLYKTGPSGDSSVIFRAISVNSFIELMNLTDQEQYLIDAEKNISFISATYYNDAIKKMEDQKLDNAEDFFNMYEKAIQHINENDINKKINFYLALATKASYLYKSDSSRSDIYFNKAVSIYKKILAIDSNNIKANYNLGVLYYNKAVNIISALDVDEVDLIAFSQIEDRSIQLFRQSLPYMKNAYNLNPSDKNAIEGLAGIYFSLRDFEESDKFKKMIDQ